MNGDEIKSLRKKNFIATLKTRRAIILGGTNHPFERFDGFIRGLIWSAGFHDDGLDEFADFLRGIHLVLNKRLLNTEYGRVGTMGWAEYLLTEAGMDEEKAFNKLIEIIEETNRTQE